MGKTERCHIIRQGYMRGFENENGKLYYFEKNKDGKFIFFNERTTYGIGGEKNVFNYFDLSLNKRIVELEEKLANEKENYLTHKLNKIKKDLSDGKNIEFKLEEKKFFLDLIFISIWKITFHKLWKIKYGIRPGRNTESDIRELVFITDGLMEILESILIHLLDENRNWKILKTDGLFYFGDSNIFFRANPKNGNQIQNNLSEFFSNEYSNVFFPLSKDLALVIENDLESARSGRYNVLEISKEEILSISNKQIKYNLKNSKGPIKELLYEAILYRIPQNCDWYVAGSDKDILEESINGYEGHALYWKDPIMFVIDEKLPEMAKNFKFFQKNES